MYIIRWAFADGARVLPAHVRPLQPPSSERMSPLCFICTARCPCMLLSLHKKAVQRHLCLITAGVVMCRMAMVELDRALARCVDEAASAEDAGLTYARMADVYYAAHSLFSRHKMLSSANSEWPPMRRDLLELASPLPAHAKQRVVQRMMSVYTIFKP